jgi:hypothetical protein
MGQLDHPVYRRGARLAAVDNEMATTDLHHKPVHVILLCRSLSMKRAHGAAGV